MHILHIIPAVGPGGACRAMVNLARQLCQSSLRQSIVALQPLALWELSAETELGLVKTAHSLSQESVCQLISQADIVHGHFWNHPRLYQFFQQALPPMRLVLWSHVGGVASPQVVPAEVVDLSDRFVATSPYTLHELAQQPWYSHQRQKLTTILPFTAPERLGPGPTQPHEGFTIGYIGTTTPNKIHPRFVSMSAAVKETAVRFTVCGGEKGCQQLQLQAQELGVAHRFDFKGYVKDVKSVLATLDVFGYPLCADNYSTTELVLQEAMAAGVPPVVLNHGGAGRTVIHNQTGLVVEDEAAYGDALRYLYHHPQERQRLARQAQDYARQHFSPRSLTQQWLGLYEQLRQRPKRQRRLRVATGKEAFIRSLGHRGDPFYTSAADRDLESLLTADAAVAAASPVLCDRTGGGIRHYQETYRQDPYLLFWTGLTFQHQGDNVRALGSLLQAQKLGFPHWRIALYLLRAARALGAGDLARQYQAALAPHLTPYPHLAQDLEQPEVLTHG